MLPTDHPISYDNVELAVRKTRYEVHRQMAEARLLREVCDLLELSADARRQLTTDDLPWLVDQLSLVNEGRRDLSYIETQPPSMVWGLITAVFVALVGGVKVAMLGLGRWLARLDWPFQCLAVFVALFVLAFILGWA